MERSAMLKPSIIEFLDPSVRDIQLARRVATLRPARPQRNCSHLEGVA
jgi:hypothetical protein